MKLGGLIKEYRDEHGISQRQFATACGLSNGYISMLEKGENPKTGKPVTPTLQQLKKLADGMGMTMMDMLDRVDDMPIDITEVAPAGVKKSAPANEGGRTDPLDLEIASLILRLSPAKKREAIGYLRYLAERAEP